MADETTVKTEQEKESFNPSALFDILGKLGVSTQGTPQAEKPSGENPILSSILSNPELLSKLPELISLISPVLTNLTSGATPASAAVKETQSKPSIPAYSQSREAQNSHALLCALKPYLKKERQEAIDYMIKLSRLGDILKSL